MLLKSMSLHSGCFDNLTINGTAALNQASLVNLAALQPAFIMWIVASFLNIPAAILTFLTMRKSKSIGKTATNIFLQQANMCISLASLSFSIMAVYHIVNLHTDTSELQCRYDCFIEIGHQSLLFSLANSFILAIAVDRFYATVSPLHYNQMVDGTGLEVIKQKHSKQLFKALVLHSIVQASTLIVCHSRLLYGAIVQSDRGSNDGPYFTILNTTSGLSNFVIYLICLKTKLQKFAIYSNEHDSTIDAMRSARIVCRFIECHYSSNIPIHRKPRFLKSPDSSNNA
uniref:G-protein coupled receptors family 1 profile domain-containing protein n=1 Tax=Romanomermis culicivorax TaxID=13658 RepID=A0A915J644_ROMCU